MIKVLQKDKFNVKEDWIILKNGIIGKFTKKFDIE